MKNIKNLILGFSALAVASTLSTVAIAVIFIKFN